MKKFAKCNLTVALTLVQVNPLPLSERSSVRPHYFEYAQFELCLAKICGLLGSVRTPPPTPSLPVAFSTAGYCKVATSVTFHTLMKAKRTGELEENRPLDLLLYCVTVPRILATAKGFKTKGAHTRWQYICYVICWWKWLNRIFKAVASPDNLSHDASLSSRTSRICDIFRSRSLRETLSHTLTLNYFLSDSSRAFDETWSPQVHLVTLGASCAQVLTFKPLKKEI